MQTIKRSTRKRVASTNRKKPFRWLLIYHTIRVKEVREFEQRVAPHIKFAKKKCKNVGFDMLYISRPFGSRVPKPELDTYKVVSYVPETKTIKTTTHQCKSMNECVKDLFDRQFKMFGRGYDGVMYSGHANGLSIGHQYDQAIENKDFVALLRKHVRKTGKKFECVAFDTCYQGLMETLYEYRTVTKYLMASPSYHDHRSLIETKEFFYKDPKLTTLGWLKKITDSYVNDAERTQYIDYPIMNNVFSAAALGKLGRFIYRNKLQPLLTFNKSTQIYHDDPNLHSLDAALRVTKNKSKLVQSKIAMASNMLKKAVLYAPHNPKNKLAKQFPKLAIRSYLPDYVTKDEACRVKMYKGLLGCK